LLERAAKVIAEQSAAVSAQASRDASYASVTSVVLMLIVLGIAMIGAFLFSRAICGRSIARSPVAGGGGGDLTRTVDAAGRDEIADLLRALQTMQASLSEVVHEVRTHAEAVATAAEIASGNHDLSSRTESQAASLEETAASMTELTGIVGKSAEHAQYAAHWRATRPRSRRRAAGDDRRRPDDGRHRREFGEGRRDHRRDRRHRVPDQHPRAERGRRGGAGRRAGRGFAVVASEVRSLAQRSVRREGDQGAHRAIDAARRSGAVLIGRAGDSIREIVGAVERVTTIVGEISSASRSRAPASSR
jgi:methyl-accepting chemotaxis protein-1 (serine sensor receptor)